ncbi:MAG: hypothetical protein M3340_02885 [Actinomycetota bacterium]|nr:hypothetical protein [Actinomycetota bacterium]
MRAVALIAVLVAVAASPAAAQAASLNWSAGGPDGGTVSAVAIDPSRTATMYAGTLGAGVFKSDDGGDRWVRASNGLPVDTSVLEMEVARSDPRTLYIRTTAGQLFRTSDGAAGWVPLARPEAGSMDDITVDPSDPSRVFAGATEGVSRSTDGGATWQLVNPGRGAQRVGIAPSAPNVVYAIADNAFMRSTDGGSTWAKRTNALSHYDFLTVSPEDPDTVYTFSQDFELLRSTDGAVTWQALFTAPPLSEGSLSIFPGDPNRLYLGFQGHLFTSADRGSTWTDLAGLPADWVRDVEVDPADPRRAFVAMEHRGLFRVSGAPPWVPSNRGIFGDEIRSLAVSRSSPSTVYAGTYGGVARSRDAGRSWSEAGLDGLIVSGLDVSPGSPNVALAAANGTVMRTVDGGRVWRAARGLPVDDYRAVAMAPSDARSVYAGAYRNGVFRSRDGGRTWRRTKLNATIFSVAVHPRRPGTVWAAGAGLYRSTNGGRTWRTMPVDPAIDLTHIEVNPRDPRVIYLGIDGGALIVSTDGGRTWRPPGSRPPLPTVSALAIDPRNPRAVYAGGYDPDGRGGVFKSTNAGATWTDVTGTMTTTWVASLAIAPNGSRIYAGTTAYGRESGGGVFGARLR